MTLKNSNTNSKIVTLLYLSFLLNVMIYGCSRNQQDPVVREKPKSSPGIPVIFADSPEEKEVLSKPFVGITTDGHVQKNLFTVKSTGVSTLPVRDAVNSFLGSLSNEQKSKCTFTIDDNEWRRWHNIDIYQRDGIGFFEMTDEQKELAFNILKQSLSVKGLEKTKKIMAMEEHLAYLIEEYVKQGYDNLKEPLERIGIDQFYLTFMGMPSKKEPWGWQIDGHHLVINYFVLGDQVVMTPTFMGTEPTYAEMGKHEGLKTFEEEERKGIQFYAMLSPSQKLKATLWPEKKHSYNQTEAFRDNEVLTYKGLPAKALNESLKSALLDLIEEYIGNMSDGHAQIKMAEIKIHLEETWFSWIGPGDGQSPFYYRIHSPVVLIEFDHQRPVFHWDRTKDRPGPTKNHIHTVVRTPNGNDYGRDLLRQHLGRYHGQ